MRHGYSRYVHDECRCVPCTAANARHQTGQNARRRAALVVVDGRPYSPILRRHGTVNGYSNYGCRCAPCTAANTTRHARWRATRAG